MRRFGLIGYPLSHSFSQRYFSEKFEKQAIADAVYDLFPLPSLDGFASFASRHPDLVGLNVTIPYKETILPYLEELDPIASQIQAVNVLKRLPSGNWKGYNSDVDGFCQTLDLLLPRQRWSGKSALIFGSGGASKAVAFALKTYGVSWSVVSRSGPVTYQKLTVEMVETTDLLVNCTPVGMYPHSNEKLPIPYQALHPGQMVIDLVYNPEHTLFLQEADKRGAHTLNGIAMLYAQAEKAWRIWSNAD